MPAFNIQCDKKYLIVDFGKWFKTDCLIEAKQYAIKNGGIIYESLYNDWFELRED